MTYRENAYVEPPLPPPPIPVPWRKRLSTRYLLIALLGLIASLSLSFSALYQNSEWSQFHLILGVVWLVIGLINLNTSRIYRRMGK